MRSFLLALFAAALLGGCGDDHAGHDHDQGGHMKDAGDGDVESALKALGPEDEKLARAQKTCPVSGEPLGSMGVPIKVTAGGKAAFLCCEGCRKRFERDPDKYLAKLGK